MNSIVSILVLVFALSVDCRSHRLIRPRVFGGNAALRGQFPYLASIRHANWDGVIHQCGGAILSEKFILAAGHCVDKFADPQEYLVAVNALNRFEGETYKVKKFHFHEYYVSTIAMNDILVIELESPLRLSENVQKIDLETEFIGSGIEGVVAGYGETNDDIHDLKYITMKTLTNEECHEHFKTVSSDDRMPIHERTTLCAETGSAGNSLCYGDSGGPFVLNNRIIGIVSWGKSCEMGLPEGFTRISQYIGWIHSITETL